VVNTSSMKEAASRFAEAACAPVVVKGGHLRKAAVNILYDGSRFHLFEKPRLRREVHGTGCFFSAALLALLASGASLVEAAGKATDLTHEAIAQAGGLGRGRLVISPATLSPPARRSPRTRRAPRR